MLRGLHRRFADARLCPPLIIVTHMLNNVANGLHYMHCRGVVHAEYVPLQAPSKAQMLLGSGSLQIVLLEADVKCISCLSAVYMTIGH